MHRAAAAVVALLATRTAAADPRVTDADARARLAAARTEIDGHAHALRYAEARAAAEAALAIGAATPDDVAALARAAGEASAALDDAAAAERWFTLWLELRPTDDLPAGSSPKLTEPLAAARAKIAHGLGYQISDRDGEIILQLHGDPAQAVASVEVGSEHLPITPSLPFVDLTHRTGELLISLRDRHGNELRAPERHVLAPGTSVVPPRPSRSILTRPSLWIGASVAVGALGGVFLWRRSVAKDDLADVLAHSEDHTLADAEAARSRAGTHGILANVSLGFAAGFALTAAYFAFRSPDEPITIAPTSTGVSILALW